MKNSKLTKDQRREIRKKAQETERSWEGNNSEVSGPYDGGLEEAAS